MKRIKKTLYISLIALSLVINPANPVSTMFNTGSKEAYAAVTKISAEGQSAITKIKSEQTATGSIVSEHLNEKRNGHTTVKMLEIPGYQLSDTIKKWKKLGHGINEDTIHNEAFIKYLINNTDIKSFSYTAKVPMLYFLVKNELAEPILYAGKI